MPYSFAWILGNPLDNPPTASPHAKLSPTKQAVLLLVLVAVKFSGQAGIRGEERKEDLVASGFEVEHEGDERMEAKYVRDEEKGRKAS